MIVCFFQTFFHPKLHVKAQITTLILILVLFTYGTIGKIGGSEKTSHITTQFLEQYKLLPKASAT